MLIGYHDVALARARCWSCSRCCCSTLFVYGVGFAGQEERPEEVGRASTFLRYTIAGYGIALAVSLYVLWTFGRIDGGGSARSRDDGGARLPGALGAAIARLVV